MAGAWKRSVLVDWDQGAIADATTTQTVKLPQTLISAIHVRLSGTGGSGTPAVDNLLTELKVKTDKGYVFDMLSADMRAIARALAGYAPIVTNATGAYTAVTHHVMFGRYPRDKNYMLDLRNSAVRQIELSFGTLIATTAWATGTVVLTITIDEWVGDADPDFAGMLGWRLVEDRATGTGRTTFDLFQGYKCPGILVYGSNVTTLRQVTLSDKKQTIIFAQADFQDLLDMHNVENNPDARETTYALLKFFGEQGDNDVPLYPDISRLTDPALVVERGTTTVAIRIHQGMLFQ